MVDSTASGGASNSWVDIDQNTVLFLQAYYHNWWHPEGDDALIEFYGATAFSGEWCSGDSIEIWLDRLLDGITTGTRYRDLDSNLSFNI